MIAPIKRIAILGGESTGKSTLSQGLASQLTTTCTNEYGRDLWLEKKGKLVFCDFLLVAQTQVAKEEECTHYAKQYLICDTTPLTTLFYSLDAFGKADASLIELANRKYDYTFLCTPDFPFVQDGTRTGAEYREMQQLWYKRELAERNVTYYEISGNITQRITQILRILPLS